MDCLLVEDDDILSQVFEAGLEGMGHKVDCASTVRDGMRRLRTHKYDLLLLDFHLPDGNSLVLSEYAAATCPNLRTILMTGSGIFPRGEHGLMAPGVDWVMRKPVPIEDLQAMVDYAGFEVQSRPLRAG